LSDGEIESKVYAFSKLARPRDVTAIIDTVWQLDSEADVRAPIGFAGASA
jgi:hypothetical protein